MATYVVSVKTTDPLGQTLISGRATVYCDTELEAKHQGAKMIGASPDAVTVTLLGDTGMAQNAQIIGRQGQ